MALFRHEASGYESPRAGTSQGIFFKNFLPCLIRAHFVAFPGWQLWIHHDDRVMEWEYFKVYEKLCERRLIKLIPMGKAETLCGSMLWRMRPTFYPQVEFFISRDVDSLPMHRDRLMVEEAIQAGAALHAILDSESHSGPLMGGMTGYRPSALRDAFPQVKSLPDFMVLAPDINFNRHGSDQEFLNSVVWPRLFQSAMIHQRRRDIQYSQAMRTRPVYPRVTALDKVIRHIGAGYPVEEARAVLDAIEYPEKSIIEECEA